MDVSGRAAASARSVLDALRAADDGFGSAVLDTGVSYLPGQHVRIFVRKRDGRYDLTDGGAAVDLAGRPTGWLGAASDAVIPMGMNVNRRGVVYVTGFERRDVADLAMRLAECSRLVFVALLELDD